MKNKPPRIILLNQNSPKTGPVWRKEWISPFESPWGIFEKFKFANVATVDDIMFLFGNEHIKKKKTKSWSQADRNLLKIPNLDVDMVKSVFGFSIQDRAREEIDRLAGIIPVSRKSNTEYFRKSLTICEECMRTGYHSIFHQFSLIDLCPFHEQPLQTTCPNCNRYQPYELTDELITQPFRCRCGHSFLNDEIKDAYIPPWESMRIEDLKMPEMLVWLESEKVQKSNAENMYMYAPFAEQHFDKILARHLVILEPTFKTHERTFHRVARSPKSFGLVHTTGPEYVPRRSQIELPERLKGFITKNEYYKFSKKTHGAIARKLRKTILEKHRTCIKRLVLGSPIDNEFCPFAYAYVMWRTSIEGLENHRIVDNGGRRRRKSPHDLEFVIKYASPFLYQVFGFWEKHYSLNTFSDFDGSYWLFNHLVAHLSLEHFKNWLRVAQDHADSRVMYRSIPSSQEKGPYSVIVLPDRKGEAVEFHWWNDWPEVEILAQNLKCPFESVKSRRRRNSKTPDKPRHNFIIDLMVTSRPQH